MIILITHHLLSNIISNLSSQLDTYISLIMKTYWKFSVMQLGHAPHNFVKYGGNTSTKHQPFYQEYVEYCRHYRQQINVLVETIQGNNVFNRQLNIVNHVLTYECIHFFEISKNMLPMMVYRHL